MGTSDKRKHALLPDRNSVKKHESSKDEELETQYLLRKLLALETADLASGNHWLWEGDRWKELVFALLAHITGLAEDQVRELTDHMENLGLLDVGTLASIGKGSSPDLNSPNARHILELLQENGFSPEESQSGLTTICEAAVGLQKHFGGKVQRYLRSYGESMLREINQFFRFSKMEDPEVKLAFTYWLQNVLTMPLSLFDSNVVMFCERHHLTPEELIAAADDLDLNVALLDDLIQLETLRYASGGDDPSGHEPSGFSRPKHGSTANTRKRGSGHGGPRTPP